VAVRHYESRVCDKSKTVNKLDGNSAQVIDSKDLCRRGGGGMVELATRRGDTNWIPITHGESRPCDKSNTINKLDVSSAQVADSKDLCRRGEGGGE